MFGLFESGHFTQVLMYLAGYRLNSCFILHQAMEASGKQTFLIDGFPRNKDNLDGWNTAMSEVAQVRMVLFFSCCEGVCSIFLLL